MKKIPLFLAFVSLMGFGYSQNVSISPSGTPPNASAMLDIMSTTRGLLVPRMTTAQKTGIATPATGLLVFDITVGAYFYYTGTAWVPLFDSNLGWGLTGNTGVAASDFIGSINNVGFKIRTNNVERMRITAAGDMGIGTITPSEKLDVVGNIKASGAAYWGASGTRTENRADAGAAGVGIRSGYYQTAAPAPAANWPVGAASWWHLLDIRHHNSANNFAMQFAGSFSDQDLYFRKTNNNAAQPWSKILTTANGLTGSGVATRVAFWSAGSTLSSNANLYWDNTNSRLGIGTAIPSQELTLAGGGNVFGVDNTASFAAKNSVGTYETYFWPRWSDNVMYLNYGTGGFNIRNNAALSTMFMTNAGNVGIGTTAPATQLHTTGIARFDGGVQVDALTVIDDAAGWHRSYGSTGWINNTHGGGWFMSDNTWIRTFGSKSIYHNAGIMRTDGTFQVDALTVIDDAAGWHRSYGPTGWINNTYGGGWFMSDNTWIRTFGSKSIYHNAGIMRTDGTFQVGGAGVTLNVINGGNFSYRTNVLFANTAGNVGIGTAVPTYKLHVIGRIKTNGINETSDVRLKKNISTLKNSLEKVMAMRGVSYEWRVKEFPKMGLGKGNQIGVIAQEIEGVLPQVVDTDSEGWKSVEYGHIVPLLIEAIKEQESLIQAQKAKLMLQQSQISTVQTELNTLKVSVNQLLQKEESVVINKQ